MKPVEPSPDTESRRERRHAVRWLWATGLVAGSLSAYLGAVSGMGVPRSVAFLDYNEQRVSRYISETRTERQAARIVMIGGDALKFATLPAQRIEARAETLGLGEIRVLRIVEGPPIFGALAGLREPLLAARPDILVVQADLLARVPRGPRPGATLFDYLRWRAFGEGEWNPGGADQGSLQNAMDCSAPDLAGATVLDADHKTALAAQAFVAEAARRGIHVVLLDLPSPSRSDIARAPPPPPELERATERLPHLATLEEARYPHLLPSARFCANRRLTHSGRTLFTDWLLHRIRPVPGSLARAHGGGREASGEG